MNKLDNLSHDEIGNLLDEKEKEFMLMTDSFSAVYSEWLKLGIDIERKKAEIGELKIKRMGMSEPMQMARANLRRSQGEKEILKRAFWSKRV